MRTIGHFIAGRLIDGRSGRTLPVFDPARGTQTGEVQLASGADVDDAVASAVAASKEWAASSLAVRTGHLFKLRELIHKHSGDLAAAITAEHGKVRGDADGEVSRALENVEFACGIANHLKGGHSASVSTGVSVHEVHQPLGVVAGITPFNFPVMVPLWMIANAIACGNTFILKPSEKDPSPSLVLADLIQKAGIPDGVVNVVQGDKVAVDALLDHPDVSAVSFVGSTAVARYIHGRATVAGKRVQALGGAKNHLVVLPDADVGMAADAAVSAAYGSAGERCMAISVLVPVGDVAEPLLAEIEKRIGALKVGPGDEVESEMGPLITEAHRDRVAGYVESALGEGATIVVDGRKDGSPSGGFFLGPCLVDNVTPDMAVYRDEVFGPVLSVVRAETFDEALHLVNANPYGNGAAIYTRDGGAATRFSEEVTAGMVGVNVPIPVPVSSYSFGGWKDSLFGDSHIYGPEGVRFYTRTKVVTTRWPDPATSAVDLGFPTNR